MLVGRLQSCIYSMIPSSLSITFAGDLEETINETVVKVHRTDTKAPFVALITMLD